MNDGGAEREILAERARVLAAPVESGGGDEWITVIAFLSGSEDLCVEAEFVREVVRLRQLARVPGAPPAVRGITTYRGEVLAAIDITRSLGRAGASSADQGWLVVMGTEDAEFGLLADEVRGAVRISRSALLPLSSEASTITRRLARAVTEDATLVLDGGALLAEASPFASSGHAPSGDT